MKLSLRKRFEQFQHNQNTQRNLDLVTHGLLIAILAFFVIRPTVTNIRVISENKKAADTLLSQLVMKRASLENAEKAVTDLQPSLPLYADALPNEPQQFDLLNTLRIVAEREGVVLDQLSHTFGTEGQVSFTITGGGTYEQITRYVESLEQVPRLVTLKQIVVTKNEINDESIAPDLSIAITGHGYYYVSPVELLVE